MDLQRALPMAKLTFFGTARGTHAPLARLFAVACHTPKRHAAAIPRAAHRDVLGGCRGLATGARKRTRTGPANSPNQLLALSTHVTHPRRARLLFRPVKIRVIFLEARFTIPLAIGNVSRLRCSLGAVPVSAPAKPRLRIARRHG